MVVMGEEEEAVVGVDWVESVELGAPGALGAHQGAWEGHLAEGHLVEALVSPAHRLLVLQGSGSTGVRQHRGSVSGTVSTCVGLQQLMLPTHLPD